jgi:hypothetical protein
MHRRFRTSAVRDGREEEPMAHEIRTEIEIDAPTERVWSVLTDFAAYPSWNPFVVHIEGNLAPEGRLEVHLRPPGGSGMKFRPRITEFEKGRRLGWMGHLGIPGLFDGAHHFEVVALPGNRTRMIQSERFSGVLVPFLKKSLEKGTRDGFVAMNQATKVRAEMRS